jgi:hypothetical protein
MIIPELQEDYIDFIGFYQNVLPEGFCEHLIEQFNILQKDGFCGTRRSSENAKKTLKSDSFCFFNVNVDYYDTHLTEFEGNGVRNVLQNGLQRCFDAYIDNYDILHDLTLTSTDLKMQKTDPGEGYHVWHCEQNNGHDQAKRCLVWTIYLNDIEEAGETEFLYQKLRVKPKKNTALIWPAAYTHTHRGNVVHGNKSKYIMTGWFHLK